MSTPHATHAVVPSLACALALSPGLAQAASQAAGDLATLREFTVWLAIGALVLVFALVVLATVAHHLRRAVSPPPFHRSLWIELLWAVAPWLMVLLIAVPATMAVLGLR